MVKKGQILSILGHNGAGKTTLLGILTGLISPDEGQAHFYNYSLAGDVDEIRKNFGICPQFDILWDELTAHEHLYMYCKIKRVSAQKIEETIA